MRIALASDHAGYGLKAALVAALRAWGHEAVDLGVHGEEAVDYPDFAHLLARCLGEGGAERGVLVCGSGIGMAMAANRHPHIRAAACHDLDQARLARRHNDANVLALGGRLIGAAAARNYLRAFVETPFEGGRHRRRIDKLSLPAGMR